MIEPDAPACDKHGPMYLCAETASARGYWCPGCKSDEEQPLNKVIYDLTAQHKIKAMYPKGFGASYA